MLKPTKLVTEAQQRFSFTRRAFVLTGAQTLVGGLLVARMGYLSIIENREFKTLSDRNSINLALIPPRRGWIVDRHDKPLALNRISFRVDVIPDRMVNNEKTIAELAALLNLSPDDHAKITDTLADAAGFQPVQIADNLSYEAYAALSIRAAELPGVAPAQSYSRYYPTGAAVAHLLGYVGTPSAKDYTLTHDPLLITPGFKVGKDGIEKMMEPRLRGQPGARRTEVTARGKWVRDLTNRPDIPGKTQRLTIDADVQAYASRRLGPASGACVVLDCNTGDVLAMTSMPAYDPNSFTAGIAKSEWQMLQENDHLPLSNKALQGLYPSGSTIKPAMALAILAAGISPDATVRCTGSYRVGNTIFHCDKRSGHGTISLHRAIVQSCDIYFYHFGVMTGIDRIAPMLRAMSLGQKYDLPTPSQRYGTVPDAAWLERHYHHGWNTYDTINLSIGQGYLLVNPLQLAVMAGRLASGRAIVPHLLYDHPHAAAPLLNLDPTHLDFIRKAMWGVVNETGTAAASRININGVHLAGKTGTAQVRRIIKPGAVEPWKYRDHSLFIGFIPADAPRYAAACIIEHGGQGARAAAPIVKDTLSYLFDPATAMTTLEKMEAGWGGTIDTRMQAERAAWNAAHAPKPQAAPPSDNVSNATADGLSGADANSLEAATPADRKNTVAAKQGNTNDSDVPAAPEPINAAGPTALPPQIPPTPIPITVPAP